MKGWSWFQRNNIRGPHQLDHFGHFPCLLSRHLALTYCLAFLSEQLPFVLFICITRPTSSIYMVTPLLWTDFVALWYSDKSGSTVNMIYPCFLFYNTRHFFILPSLLLNQDASSEVHSQQRVFAPLSSWRKMTQESPGSKRRNMNLRTKWLKQVLVMWVCHTYAIGDLKSNDNVNIADITRDYQKCYVLIFNTFL